jgi:hypothetical protein
MLNAWSRSGGLQNFQLSASFIQDAVFSVIGDTCGLLIDKFPTTYDDLLSSGKLPVIFKNRYTNEPIKNTEEYSRGDIYYSADLKKGVILFLQHMGEKDQIYKPGATSGAFWPYVGGMEEMTTNGRTVKYEKPFDPAMPKISPEQVRTLKGIPADDIERAKIYIVASWVGNYVQRLSAYAKEIPSSLDGYIEMIGWKNPVAWTNPYTGQPMKLVDYYDVQIYDAAAMGRKIPGDYAGPKPPDDVIGNFAYKPIMKLNHTDPQIVHILFYFREADGSISAYRAIGFMHSDPQEHLESVE